MGQPDEAPQQKAGDHAQQAIPQGFGAGAKSGHFGANPEKQGHPKTQESEPRQSFGKALGGEGNPNHDELGRFSSVFALVRTKGESRGLSFLRTKLVGEHVDALASSAAEILANTKPVRLPAKSGCDARKGAFDAAKQVSSTMREQGIAIRNQGSGALIELNVRGLKHAKTMSGRHSFCVINVQTSCCAR